MTSYARATKVLSGTAVRLLDGLLVVYGFVTMYGIRGFFDQPGVRSVVDLLPDRTVPKLVAPLGAYWWLIVLAAVYWPIVLEQQGFYHHPAHLSWKKAAWISVKTVLLMLAGLLALLFLLHVRWANRTYVVGAVVWTGLLILGRHSVQSYLLTRQVREGRSPAYAVLLVASRDAAPGLVRWLREHPEEYYVPVGIILTDPSGAGDRGPAEVIEDVPVCGGVGELARAMHQYGVSSVIIGGTGLSLDLVRDVVLTCEVEGVDSWLMADFVQTRRARATADRVGGRDGILFTSATGTEWQKAIKRVIDIVGALALIILLAPVMLVVAVLVRCTSPGPVLFRQARAGLHGRPFTMLKFRSMYHGADRDKERLEEWNEMEGPVFKITNDPRVTPLGRILRRWSLDELPQLFNVLVGQMSLVGPRPLPVYEVEKFYDLAHRRRLSMKPGLTCLWQIRGRNKLRSFEEWVRLDLEYIDNWSLWLDLKILAKTLWVVLQGSGV